MINENQRLNQMVYFKLQSWGGGVSESMDGRECGILALEVMPKNLIFA